MSDLQARQPTNPGHRARRILVTNDDGVDSEGLAVLARALGTLGSITVVAPDREYSGAAAALGPVHLIRPEAHRASLEGVHTAWAVSGPPALCVLFASLGVFGGPFDLVVAGINPGENVGRSVYHSGTVGAALTARTRGMPGLAVSQAVRGSGVEGQGWDEMLVGQHWPTAASAAVLAAGAILSQPGTPPVVVNLNVPDLAPGDLTGWRATTLATVPARAINTARLEAKVGRAGAYELKMGWGDAVTLPPGTDGAAVADGEVSITCLGSLTAVNDRLPTALTAALDARWPPGAP